MSKFFSLAIVALLVISSPTFAQLQLTTDNGWTAFSILDQGENISAISDSGYGNTLTRGTNDGLGIYRTGDNSLTVWVNHETTPASISRVEVDRQLLRQGIHSTLDSGTTPFPADIKTGIGFAYDSIFDSYNANTNPNPAAQGTSAVDAYADDNFVRFCSGTSHLPNSFGTDRGFADNIYMTGEETNGGNMFALNEATRELWVATDMGTGRWENAALVDTGTTTHVAILMMSDVSSGGDYIRMYVGQKNIDDNNDGTIDFLERNGLRGGTVYNFHPSSGSTTDLPDGNVSGFWNTSTSGALVETKLEDVHTNPNNGSQAVFSDQTDGVYILEHTLVFNGGNFDAANSPVTISQIDDSSDAPLSAPDNLVWTENNLIFVQEDGSGNEMYQMNSDGSGLTRIATGLSEPSGIFDISNEVGFGPGSIFLVALQGSGSADAQVAVLISPNAVDVEVSTITSIDIIQGNLAAGTVAELLESDDVDVRIRRNPLQVAGVVNVEMNAATSVLVPSMFELTLEASSFNRTLVTQSIQFYDYDAGTFVEVDSRPSPRFVDGIAVGVGFGDLSRFVDDSTGAVQVRVLYTSASARQSFTSSIDQVILTIRQ